MQISEDPKVIYKLKCFHNQTHIKHTHARIEIFALKLLNISYQLSLSILVYRNTRCTSACTCERIHFGMFRLECTGDFFLNSMIVEMTNTVETYTLSFFYQQQRYVCILHVYRYVHMHIYIYAHKHVCILYVCARVHMHAHVYVCVCRRIHKNKVHL